MSAEKKRALRQVRRAAERLEIAKESRDSWIRDALEIASVREVAEAANLSSARAHQIRHGR